MLSMRNMLTGLPLLVTGGDDGPIVDPNLPTVPGSTDTNCRCDMLDSFLYDYLTSY